MKNRFFRVPILFDAVKLNNDLDTCLFKDWSEHFNKQDYSGSWTSISLRSASGSEKDIYSHPGNSCYSDTSLLNRCSYFHEIMDVFQCEKESVRLMRLAPGSRIHEHRDLHAGYLYGSFRLHIPILTGKEVSFIVAGCELDMKPGECWYADFSLPHSVMNKGKTDRIHLVLDCKRNSWSDELFIRAGYEIEEEKRKREYDRGTKRQMIVLLSSMNTDASRELIEQLKSEIQQSGK